MEQHLSVERLKPFVKLHEERQPPLHYNAELCEIHDDSYVVERVDKHEWRGKGANGREKRARQPFSGAKPWWYVKFLDHARLEWHPAASLLHNINSTWMKYNVQHGLRVELSNFNVQRVQVDDGNWGLTFFALSRLSLSMSLSLSLNLRGGLLLIPSGICGMEDPPKGMVNQFWLQMVVNRRSCCCTRTRS